MQPIRKQSDLYTKNQIDFAAFFGGPLAAGYLISKNFRTFGELRSSKLSLLISFVTLVLLTIIISLSPTKVVNSIGSISFGVLITVISALLVKKFQTKNIDLYKKNGYKTASNWKVFGLILLNAAITIIVIIVFTLITVYLNVKYNYAGYLEDYCSNYYIESKIEKNKLYVPEDAACYVHSKLLTNGISLMQVNEVLTLENQYHLENTDKEYNPNQYILEKQKSGLTAEQIDQVIKSELDYMRFIGIEISK